MKLLTRVKIDIYDTIIFLYFIDEFTTDIFMMPDIRNLANALFDF